MVVFSLGMPSVKHLLTRTYRQKRPEKEYLELLYYRKFIKVTLCSLLSALLIFAIAEFWSDLLFLRLPIAHYIFLGSVSGICSVVGDLFESFLKRCAGVKVSLFHDYVRTLVPSCPATVVSLTDWTRYC